MARLLALLIALTSLTTSGRPAPGHGAIPPGPDGAASRHGATRRVWTSGDRVWTAGERQAMAAPGRPSPRADRPADRRGARARVVAAARRHLGKRFSGDCSGFVRSVYAEAHVPLPPLARGRSATEAMYRSLSPVRRPRPGDLAFFHHTYDRDPRGPRRDLFTHVAVVEAVDGPRVSLIHRGGAGVRRFIMNLALPADPDENGALRRRRRGDRPRARYLASQLFAGYATAVARGSARR